MPKNPKRQVVYCLQHDFSLIPLKSQLYFKQPITLSFCKGRTQAKCKSRQPKKTSEQQKCACFPVYNKDGNYATSTFILPEEQQNFIENSQKLKLEHQHRVLDYNQQKSKLLIPKPKTRYSYCNACRENYEDYLQHIKQQKHKNNIRKSKITQHMKDLQKKYSNINRQNYFKNQSNIKNIDNCGTSVTNYLSQTDIAAQVQQLGRPQKKVKISNEAKNGEKHNRNIQNQNACMNNGLEAQYTNMNNLAGYHNMNMETNMNSMYRGSHLYPINYDYNYFNQYGYPVNMLGHPYVCWGAYNNFYNMPFMNMLTMNNNHFCKLETPKNNFSLNNFNKPIIIDLEAQDQ